MLIDPSESTLLIVDIQEKLFSKIENSKSLLSVVERALLVFKVMGTPIVYSEQYPKGLGLTISSLRENLSDTKSVKIEKTSFACFSKEDKIIKAQDFIKSKQVIICGIETHICVLQTALDLIIQGYEVFVLNEGVGSRSKDDNFLAFQRLRKNNVSIVSIEMLVFELVRNSEHKHFKELSKLIK